LSQDLRWGLLSVSEVREKLAGGGESFERELAWRDFYHHLAWHQPRALREPFRREAKALPWNKDGAALAAWQRGETGYPVVDAAMRQLVETGWMHNRARMIVASLLTKNLLIDYREGERFFMRHLVDGDPAVNNGGWQWASSTGTDAQPYFRVFNPVLQGNRFDPDGVFVRRWLPVLAKVPDRWVHEPWAMPAEAQKTAACVIGRDYPAPIVALEGAAARARAFFESGRGARG
jgi:deoxyribodipyrimidine photo-lyase